ncbi:LamG-like jellyroll fold domain-containing protein [Desulfoluna butyratoxydans]|uniref:Concanavalin a-like lectin/glucanase domain n=1 Tax=Desulfoluna butyratoxydans TaxID=231438 RepID=A0A4U8YR37_9BACT|nr:LamG-like jellyroll fold domain-containing protein [Desulfoluna butyratoxydans]VFQ46184.1 concanavalin a-like lectin/glucanase domain [Desulfoluna butyratoxydans]
MAVYFKNLVTLSYLGRVVVFGNRNTTDESSKEIFFNVLDLQATSENDAFDWTGFKPVVFTKQLRPAGMSLITLDESESLSISPAEAPFRVVSDEKYISIFRQSTYGTLYVNRFTLVSSPSRRDPDVTEFSLQPAWEVRFEKSGKEDVPANEKDIQAYLDPEGKPFLEPTIELSMVTDMTAGEFDVSLLPVMNSDRFCWQFTVLNNTSKKIDLYNIPADGNNLFDLTGKTVGTDNKLHPDKSFSVKVTNGSDVSFDVTGAPAASFYTKQEKVVGPEGETSSVKRSGRFMMAFAGTHGGTVSTALVDAAVSAAGTLADIPDELTASLISEANYTLAFSDIARVGLVSPSPNPLEIRGAFQFNTWIYPKAATAGKQFIIGSIDASAEASSAPYLALVDGARLEVGFGDGTKRISCQTLQPLVSVNNWFHVEVTYSGKGANPFTLTINSSGAPLSDVTADAEPSGTALSSIGAQGSGFVGLIDRTVVSVGGSEVCSFEFNEVDYGQSPPVTPNSTSGSTVKGEVYGATLEPSNSPLGTNTIGELVIDKDNLSIYAGVADFLTPASSPYLMEGSDGLVHLYYADHDTDEFAVAHYALDTSRASFYANWAADAAHDSQEGLVTFMAVRPGSYVNSATISVANSFSTAHCDVTMTHTVSGTTETWKGVPRSLDRLVSVFAGDASGSPNDSTLSSGATVFFDYAGLYPGVWAPSDNASSPEHFVFMTRFESGLPLGSVEIIDNASAVPGTVNVNLTINPDHWAANPSGSQSITQAWTAVPVGARQFVDVMNGSASSYDYSDAGFSNCDVKYLDASLSLRAEASNLLTVFVQKSHITDFAVQIAGTGQADCDMTVTAGGASYAFPGISRDQNEMALLLNGQGEAGHYPDGYLANVAPWVMAVTDGLLAHVSNQDSKAPTENILAGAMLFAQFFTGNIDSESRVVPLARTTATIQQQGKSQKGSDVTVLSEGSGLFAAVADTTPTNGAVAVVKNTAQAPALTQGTDGGWIKEPNRFALEVNKTTSSPNYVSFDVSRGHMPSEVLAIDGDVTLEAWGRPVPPTGGETISKLLSYHVHGNVDNPDKDFQYMMGYENWYVPSFRASTTVYSSIILNEGTPNDITLHGFVRIDSSARDDGDLFGMTTNQLVKEYLRVYSDTSGSLSVSFAGTKRISGSAPTDTWTAVGMTLRTVSDTEVEIILYVDGKNQGSATVTQNFTDSLGTLYGGGYLDTGMQMKINQLALWPRALDPISMERLAESGVSQVVNPPLVCLNLNDGLDTMVASNSSYLGSEYNGTYQNLDNSSWSQDGGLFMSPFAANDQEALVAKDTGSKAWTHSAFVFRQGFCLEMIDENYVDCGGDSSLKIVEKGAMEAWVKPAVEAGIYRIIASKNGSYTLGLYPDGTAFFELSIESGDAAHTLTVKASSAIAGGQTGYLTATAEIRSIDQEYVDGQPAKPQKYGVYLDLYVDGALSGSFKKEDFDKPVQTRESDEHLYLCGSPKLNQIYHGKIGEVRFWNRVLEADEIRQAFLTHRPPLNSDGLISYWRFSEMKGQTAFDSKDVNNATITSGELWQLFPEIATTVFYVDGGEFNVEHVPVADLGGYGDQGTFTLGTSLVSNASRYPLKGGMDEVRIWKAQLTGEQISDNMNRTLSGAETNLVAYWRFDSGSGLEVGDRTGRGNTGTFVPADVATGPAWIASDAPISNEAPVVYNALNGIKTLALARITGQPSVIEYSDLQVNAYGDVFSVMKRAYIYEDKGSGQQVLYTGFKVGDLDTIYIGQVQTKPSVIGFIEGAPPLPSENQTFPYWNYPASDNSNYAGATSVDMTEASEVEYSFSASQNDGSRLTYGSKLGIISEGDVKSSVGLGVEAETTLFEYGISGGGKHSFELANSTIQESSLKNRTSISKISAFRPGGSWESISDMVNDAVGLRFITDNAGVAIVKSGTADLYMLAIKGTRTPVRYSVVPNEDIPEDMNLIPFPINNRYIKQGTLDGKIGLKNDPDYPDANLVRGSYFKPVEAYSLKRKIERKEKELEGYYEQFATDGGMTIEDFTAKIKDNPAFDWSRKISNRNIVNTYVWSSSGATYAEQTSVMDTYSETFSGVELVDNGGGLFVETKINKPIGPLAEFDLMFSVSLEKTATKAKEASQSFDLSCSANAESTLVAPIVSEQGGNPHLDGMTTELAPGKVDGYRYLAFYLTPSEENFQTLFSTVMDPNWLHNSVDANAVALRQASVAENGCWRILYRVTFVSRIPAKFQPVKSETQPPNIDPPANLDFNVWLTQIVEKLVDTDTPTPEEIGSAVARTLGTDSSDAGVLGTVLPWWTAFLTAAETYGSKEYKALLTLREDLLRYMIEKYEADQL